MLERCTLTRFKLYSKIHSPLNGGVRLCMVDCMFSVLEVHKESYRHNEEIKQAFLLAQRANDLVKFLIFQKTFRPHRGITW